VPSTIHILPGQGHFSVHRHDLTPPRHESARLELVDPSGLSWQEQIDLFSSSSLVVGASGAVMANYLLMAPGSRVLALTSDCLADFVLPAALAGISEVAFSYLTGPNESALEDHPSRTNWLHSSFSIRPKQFERALLREIASMGG
jgi:capsular polysaccharide biosynthesis protein